MSMLQEAALSLHQSGYRLVLIPAGEKGPRDKQWRSLVYTPEELRRKYTVEPFMNIGLLLGPENKIIDIEIDGATEEDRHAGERQLEELFGTLPPTASYLSRKGVHRLYAGDLRFTSVRPSYFKCGHIEFRLGYNGKAVQSLLPPSVTDGITREWIGPPLWEQPPAKLPDAVVERIVSLAGKPKSDPTAELPEIVAAVHAWLAPLSPAAPVRKDGFTAINCSACPFKTADHPAGGFGVCVWDDGRVTVACFHAKCEATLADLEAKIGPYPGPRVIVVTADESSITDQAVASLVRADIYQRGGRLVRVEQNSPPPPGVLRQADAPRIATVSLPALRDTLARTATYKRYATSKEGRQLVAVNPPQYIAPAVNGRGTWPVPTIEMVADMPILSPDGDVITAAGFDRRHGVYIASTVDYSPRGPQAAKDILLDAVCDFPFAAEHHRSAWVAALLTLFARLAFDGPAPLFMIDGNTPGAGKSLLADVAGVVTSGRKMARTPHIASDDEMRKHITAIAMKGEPLILIDNVEGTLGGKSLDAALTATRWEDRILGQTDKISMPMLTVWMATGNNVTLGRDTSRRTLPIRLESPLENPEGRTGFKYDDLLTHVREHRADLVSAALSILSGYCHAGRPNQNLSSWGSYEAWSGLVRSAVVWCGLPDPCEGRVEIRESNPDADTLGQLIDGWRELNPDNCAMRVADVFKRLHDEPDRYPMMRAAISDLPGNDRKLALGHALRKYRGRVANGASFVGVKAGSVLSWKLN